MPVYSALNEIKEPIDTVSMYVAADISSGLGEAILAKKPRRVIFNPGAENPGLEVKIKERGITVLNACTLVMLRTNQF